MQERMRTHRLTGEQVEGLLGSARIGHLGTFGRDGYPYVIPVHYVYLDGVIYFHGLNRGQKLDNIGANPNVCFQVTGGFSLIQADAPCETNTAYRSVVCLGKAFLVEDAAEKARVLDAVVAKYTPQHRGRAFPGEALEVTAVVGIRPGELHGKHYP
ncbi:MAG: pyridoxamine 5'-phosphate oxidase family protein [Deltaproteobacteria bacterium]|jgi:nitroimidazol reductase NimA-like FMN-containing flavoprotein (pyridoxamine 5'-phosphate oxidase superfamily)|nr:pyridoxamine 5'-phosphate oxidase family protein [Deltaproteobacteria bacterium]